MSLLANAVQSIQLGLDDYASGEDARFLSAVRNIHSGILLLYKAKLSSISPPGTNDSLIKKHVIPEKGPSGEIAWVGRGKKTLDVFEIEERFTSLGIDTDWQRFKKITSLRNDIEHYFTTQHRDAIQGMIADSFVVIRDFMSNELGLDPLGELGAHAWSTLLTVSEVIEKEREECERRFAHIDWQSAELGSAADGMTCGACGSPLLSPLGESRDDGVQCRSCGESEQFESFAVRALENSLGGKKYRSVKDGGDEVLTQCPFCFNDSYVVEEEVCAICGEGCTHTCELCGNSIPVSELSDGGCCGYCEHMMSKDD